MDRLRAEQRALDGPAFYDDPAVFDTYWQARARATSPNELIEEPLVLALLGPVAGLRILDLGCGDAAFGRRLLADGCASYLGVDASRRMVRRARGELRDTRGALLHQRIERYTAPPGTFDRVVSRLALQYVEDLGSVLGTVQALLVPGGTLVFSVEHPVITSCAAGWSPSTPRTSWVVNQYFATGRRETSWLGGRVVKYHRTVEDYVALVLVQQAGFRLERLREGRPELARMPSQAEFERRHRIPLFLVIAATREAPRLTEGADTHGDGSPDPE
jgi:SAM-dependent methyltransferase